MNAPPRHEQAVADGANTRTAQREEASDASVDDDVVERNRLVDLQQRAARVGASLAQVSRGYMLRHATHSWHSPALDAITKVLSRMEVR